MMLAEAAHATAEGPLESFRMTARDRDELRLAGMLHDCGKITTPVHVVDKATKLQTISDRIDLVAARFDALAADTRLRAQERHAGGADATAVDSDLAAERAAQDADLAFLRRANVGQETMAAADIARVRAIAERRYRGADGTLHPVLTPDEVDNLTIRSGTLTPAERAIINRHVESTISMLERAAVAAPSRPRSRIRGWPPRAHGRHAAIRAGSRGRRCHGRLGSCASPTSSRR